jgi:hypothetical protein
LGEEEATGVFRGLDRPSGSASYISHPDDQIRGVGDLAISRRRLCDGLQSESVFAATGSTPGFAQ